MPDRYDIFLSYPSADRAPATALKAALETLGLSVWMDTERIDDADSIQRCIDTVWRAAGCWWPSTPKATPNRGPASGS